MRILSSLILVIATCGSLSAQSPHGKDFSTNCGDCHTTEGWKMNRSASSFNHDTLDFALIGQHKLLDCKMCHKTLVFKQTSKECMSCHTDIHNQTVGFECERCHTPKSWIVENITEVHQLSRFPLVGPHVTADCYDCHPSASLLEFGPLGIECFDCHDDDYMATTNPNHVEGNFSTDCSHCHYITSFSWTGGNFNHSFFPLTEGHAINDCYRCHVQGQDYSSISPECITCHQTDYNSTSNPNHSSLDFPTDCSECHTTHPGWKPADYDQHDAVFPIYSGKHNGEWDACTDCHTTPGNYSMFSCIDCHEHNKGDMDDEHDEVGGYIYESTACLECHPTGDAEESFNHNASGFPLTGAHMTTECEKCHISGYSGTPTLCFACHEPDYNQTSNPNHIGISIETACDICHTTNPDWKPALYPRHEESYPFVGAHLNVASNCFICHEGNYVNTPNYCYSCHTDDYAQTTNPSHESSQFSTECEQCHTSDAWIPATFNHDASGFPLTGAHLTTGCTSCHQSGYSGTPTICFACHENDFNQSVNPNHNGLSIPDDCEVCHTTNPGWEPATFPIHNIYYPITGAHLAVQNNCFICHQGDYINTPDNCAGCHIQDYNQTTDPNHVSAQFPTECETCHTNNAWTPSTFDHDGQYFPIYSGKHDGEWNSCSECHPNPSVYSVFTCLTCHEQAQTDDDHNEVSGYSYNSNACLNCHPDGSESLTKFRFN